MGDWFSSVFAWESTEAKLFGGLMGLKSTKGIALHSVSRGESFSPKI